MLANRIGTLNSLTTTDKTDLVSAVNEVNGNMANKAEAYKNGNLLSSPKIASVIYIPTEDVPTKSMKSYEISYGTTFAIEPVVVATIEGVFTPYTELTGCTVYSKGYTKCTVRIYNNYSSALRPAAINLIAIGR